MSLVATRRKKTADQKPTQTEINVHIRRVKDAHEKVRQSFFDFVMEVKRARDALGSYATSAEFAEKTGISASMLSRYVSIASCAPLIAVRKELPERVNTLYQLTIIRKSLEKHYDKKFPDDKDKSDTETERHFKKLLLQVNSQSEVADVLAIKRQVRDFLQNNRYGEIASLHGKKNASKSLNATLQDWDTLLEKASTFKTVFMNPPDEVFRWVKSLEHEVEQINEAYRLEELLDISARAFIYCKAECIPEALTMLKVFGLTYQGMFVATMVPDQYELINSQKILIYGDRGRVDKIVGVNKSIPSGDEGALNVAETLGKTPRLYAFAEDSIDGWICSNPPEQQDW